MADQTYPDTGFPPIDDEHRLISGRLEALRDAVRASDLHAVKATLAEVRAAVEAHFAHENGLMVGQAYPKAGRHQEAHATFLADASKGAAVVEKEGLSDGVRRWVMGRLIDWFRFHIAAYDVELGRYLAARGTSPTPAVAGEAAELEPAVEIDVEVVLGDGLTGRAGVRG